jgi:hypothetical protein
MIAHSILCMPLIEHGMTKRQVKRLLGPPHNRVSQRAFERQYRSAMFVGGRRRGDAWLYLNIPQAGDMTFIAFDGRRVATVQVQQASDQ